MAENLGLETYYFVLPLFIQATGRSEKSERLSTTSRQSVTPSQWQAVIPGYLYVYSAYLDTRTSTHYVKVLAAVYGTVIGSIHRLHYCRVQYSNGPGSLKSLVQERIHRGHVWNNFMIVFLKCPVESGATEVRKVLLYKTLTDEAPYSVSIMPTDTKLQRNFTLCVSPIFGSITRNDIVEFVEFHRLMGVEKFMFYNLSIPDNRASSMIVQKYVEVTLASQEALETIEYYQHIGVADIVPWDIPQLVAKKMHYFGQIMQQNDCLYRNMYSSKYVAFLDIDEFLLPRQEVTSTKQDMASYAPDMTSSRQQMTSWDQMIEAIIKTTQNIDKISVFSFRSNLFRTSKKVDSAYQYKIQEVFYRDAVPYPHHKKSKLIVMPTRIDMINIHDVIKPLSEYHYIWGEWSEFVPYYVDNYTATVNHYRVAFTDKKRGAGEEEQVRDVSMLRFRDQLVRNIQGSHVTIEQFIESRGSHGR